MEEPLDFIREKGLATKSDAAKKKLRTEELPGVRI
jgi:hypothetical protein